MTCKRSLVQVQPESPKKGINMFVKIFLISCFLVSINLEAFEDLEVKDSNVLGIDQLDIDALFDLSFEDDSTQSVVLLKNGYLLSLIHI